jgi:2-octaprenyl-6-methoxyphenol hydroxylase
MTQDAASGRFEIVISGASFSGLALAGALRASLGSGFRIALIDRAMTPAMQGDDGRASAISGASRHMLEALGVWKQLETAAEPVTRIELTDSSLDAGVRPVVLSYDNRLENGEPATHIVPNFLLQTALVDRVADDPDLTILNGVEAVGLTRDTRVDLSAKVALSDGRELSAPLIVAAEGKHSSLRDKAGIKVVGWGYGQTGIVTTIAHERPHGGTAVQHFLPNGPFALLPLRGDRSCVTWSENAAEAARILALEQDAFLAELEKRVGGKLGAIRLDGPRRSWPLGMQLARRYIAPRFAVVGDAAHSVHPIAGQGLNLAFRDVAALTEVIADTVRLGGDYGLETVLERYERWRRFDVTASAFVFDGLNRAFAYDNALMRAGREFALGVVDRLPALKRAFVTEAAGLSGELPRLLKGKVA